ncbi:MAG: hypothetical protein U0521_29495 [Anaerolineae bacterium]
MVLVINCFTNTLSNLSPVFDSVFSTHRPSLFLRQHNITHEGHARQIQRSDLDDFDYILAMDRENLSFILRYSVGARAEIRLFLSYAQEAGLIAEDEVPDPYYDDNFERTYDLVTVGCRALLDAIRQAESV